MENIDLLIERESTKLQLLKEYKESLTYENCTHKIDEYYPGRFILYKLPEGVEVTHGDAFTMIKWILRKTTFDKTYHSHKVLLTAKALVLKDLTLNKTIARIESSDENNYYYECVYNNWKYISFRIPKTEMQDAPFEIEALKIIKYLEWK